ncbi:hypothetical protein [Devosia sp.]|uniref:hypothetical protein n=1 Tax=Devosia sp. TaxID=1871048 RepID=UPI002735F61C|nr:hypothetical protein [Devosia sp.]MDP2778893.1 hypothetical protein [Devosia sp.]
MSTITIVIMPPIDINTSLMIIIEGHDDYVACCSRRNTRSSVRPLPYRAWTLKSADALLTRKPLDLVVINVGVQGQQM